MRMKNTYNTRRKVKKLLPPWYKRTETKHKSLKNALIVVYNWLKILNLIPKDFDSLSKNELKSYYKTYHLPIHRRK